MFKFFTILTIIVLAIIFALYDNSKILPFHQQEHQEPLLLPNPQPAPNLTNMSGMNNNLLSLEDIKEDIIIVNFWASWCAPCLKEIPDLISVIDEYEGKVALLAVSLDDKRQNIINYQLVLSKYLQGERAMFIEHSYWVWDHDKNIANNLFHTVKVPESIILDKRRFMVKKFIGQTAPEDFKKTINAILQRDVLADKHSK